MRIRKRPNEVDINFQRDILITKYTFVIDDDGYCDKKGVRHTFRHITLVHYPLKQWRLRNLKYNLSSMARLLFYVAKTHAETGVNNNASKSEDDIDTAPNDYALETDQFDLNRIKAEVSE